MKTKSFIAVTVVCVLCCTLFGVLLVAGCGKSAGQLDIGWAPPVVVSSSIGSLGRWVDLYRCRDTIIGINVLRGGLPEGLILNPDHKSWSKLSFAGAPNGYVWGCATVDPKNQNILSAKGYAENDQHVVMKAFLGTIAEGSLRDIKEIQWVVDKKPLLGETAPNIKLNDPGMREEIGIDKGIINGSEVYIPFSLAAITVGAYSSSHGPFNNGVLYSPDFGKTWQMEKISDVEVHAGAYPMCKTEKYNYYFAGDQPFWSSRKSDDSKWETPQLIAKTFAISVGWSAETGEGDTVHVCWMDRRHNKWRFNIDGPPIENDNIYYCRRKDSDSDWSKDVLLSKGLEYCYPPSISAEGKNVVVVWAGIASADKHHSEYKPNDIYYVTSKNGGETWTKPVKITDKAKDGIVSGRPKVVLLNGTIHLFYTQGELEKAKELSPGLTRLNDQPWPIYYTQRPFPD